MELVTTIRRRPDYDSRISYTRLLINWLLQNRSSSFTRSRPEVKIMKIMGPNRQRNDSFWKRRYTLTSCLNPIKHSIYVSCHYSLLVVGKISFGRYEVCLVKA